MSKKKRPRKLRLQSGLVSMRRYQYPFRQTWSQTPCSSCIFDPHHFVLSFITVSDELAIQNKAQRKLTFFEVGEAIKIKLSGIHAKKINRLIYRSILSGTVMCCHSFVSAAHILISMWTNPTCYRFFWTNELLNRLLSRKRMGVSSQFGDIHSLDIMNFFCWSHKPWFFLEILLDWRKPGCFPLRVFRFSGEAKQWTASFVWFFLSILCNSIPLEKDCADLGGLLKCGLSTEQALSKLRIHNLSPIGAEINVFVMNICANELWPSLGDFLNWYNILHVAPILDAMQKMTDFYSNKVLSS